MKTALMQRIARGHIAGDGFDEAKIILNGILARGWRASLSPWKRPDQSVHELACEYSAAIPEIRRLSADVVLSIKPGDLQYDPVVLTDLARQAEENGVALHFDAQGPEGAERSFAFLERLRGVCHRLGCTLPARWKRSAEDARRVVELGIAARIVQGQWIDNSWSNADRRTRFLDLICLLAGNGVHVRVATHDKALAVASLEILTDSKTDCELEQMLRLPHSAIAAAESMAVPVRIYVPYGHAYLPYRIPDLRQRPAIVLWLLNDLMGGTRDFMPKPG